MKKLRIVFMGTPDFAVATLGCLLMNGYNIAGVVTAPNKPAGRGRKVLQPAVKKYANVNCLPTLQPENLKDPGFISELEKFNADIFVVVAFRMLPEAVWKMPPEGTINLHASLLPDYRGAAPVNHVLINGETLTGVTTFFVNDRIDTGNILLRQEVKIYPNENAGDLRERLTKLGARLVIKTLDGIAAKTLIPVPQSDFMKPGEILKTAPKIYPNQCIINWERGPYEIYNFIRGLAPEPCARSYLRKDSASILFKIADASPVVGKHTSDPGQIISDGKTYLRIACKNGFINVLTIQLEGKSRMNIVEFLRGFRIKGFYAEPKVPV